MKEPWVVVGLVSDGRGEFFVFDADFVSRAVVDKRLSVGDGFEDGRVIREEGDDGDAGGVFDFFGAEFELFVPDLVEDDPRDRCFSFSSDFDSVHRAAQGGKVRGGDDEEFVCCEHGGKDFIIQVR